MQSTPGNHIDKDMPDDRFSHRREGFSPKVCSLSDFEYRVWSQYRLSADDYGVMPYSASRLRADNLALDRRDEESVLLALKRIVDVGLLIQFTHIESEFVFDPLWQDTQKIRFPSHTLFPVPPENLLFVCSDATQQLFKNRIMGNVDTGATREKSIRQLAAESLGTALPGSVVLQEVRLRDYRLDIVVFLTSGYTIVAEVKRLPIKTADVLQIDGYALTAKETSVLASRAIDSELIVPMLFGPRLAPKTDLSVSSVPLVVAFFSGPDSFTVESSSYGWLPAGRRLVTGVQPGGQPAARSHRLEARGNPDSDSSVLPETSSETAVPTHTRTRARREPTAIPPDHPIKAILTEYDRLFLLKSNGEPAPQPGAKEATLVKRLLGRYNQAQLVELLGKYFESNDEFIRQAGYALQVFPSQIPKLLLASRASNFFSPKTAGNETALARYIAGQRAADPNSSPPAAPLNNPFRLMRPKE